MTTATVRDWVPEQTFGSRLAMVRHHLGWNIKTAAELTGLDDGSWSAWERGASPRDMPKVIRRIHDATGVSIEWLLWGSVPATGPGTPGEQEIPHTGWNYETRNVTYMRADAA